jgi:uncharacterized membrane protein
LFGLLWWDIFIYSPIVLVCCVLGYVLYSAQEYASLFTCLWDSPTSMGILTLFSCLVLSCLFVTCLVAGLWRDQYWEMDDYINLGHELGTFVGQCMSFRWFG